MKNFMIWSGKIAVLGNMLHLEGSLHSQISKKGNFDGLCKQTQK